ANNGFGPTSGPVTLGIDLPAGLTAVSESGSGWSCSLTTATCRTNPGVVLAAGAQSQITLTVSVAADASPSAQTLMHVTGGGEISAPEIDQANHYNAVMNGGAYIDPTYIAPRG